MKTSSLMPVQDISKRHPAVVPSMRAQAGANAVAARTRHRDAGNQAFQHLLRSEALLLARMDASAAPASADVPTTTPTDCPGRNAGYCSAADRFSGDPWLKCACKVSQEICEAVDAFSFKGVQGGLAEGCIEFTVPFPANIYAKAKTIYKGQWFLATNKCIWGHWRKALDALHADDGPVPSTLTAPWASAVAVCRRKGADNSACCKAQVDAAQKAIDTCGAYNSQQFGQLPTDVPLSPICSLVAQELAPPPEFTGDFGKVADRITYGTRRCCS